MNAVILLVWLAGADGVAQAPKPVPVAAPAQKPAPGGAPTTPAPVQPYHAASSCCDSPCDSCCEGHGGHRLFGRLRGLFHRNDDCCQNDCGSGHGLFHRRHQDDCCQDDCGGGHRLFGFLHRHRSNDCCDDCGGGHKLFGRFHNIFRRHDDCCQPDCCQSAPVGVIHPQPVPTKPMPSGEKIAPPKDSKKLPVDKKVNLTPPPASFTLEAPALNPVR